MLRALRSSTALAVVFSAVAVSVFHRPASAQETLWDEVEHGYAASGDVHVADPLQDNPPFGSHYYSVNIARVLGAVLLGVLTSDANLLIVEPPEDRHAEA